MSAVRPHLTLVIDRTLYRPQDDGLEPLSLVEAAIEGGITMLQLRLAPSEGQDLAADAIAHRLREMSAGKVPFLVTSDLQLADRCGADGVVLVGDRTYHPAEVKQYLRARDRTIVGRYVDSVSSASRAERAGADFVQIGVAPDGDDAKGLAMVRKVKDAINVPLIVFGGVDSPERAAAAIEAGADGVAVTEAILRAPDPLAAAQALHAAVFGDAAGNA